MTLPLAGCQRIKASAPISSPVLRDPGLVQIEHDRVKAIALALSQASKQDIILVAGKGHEDYQIIGTDKRHYSDRETVAAALHTLMESFT